MDMQENGIGQDIFSKEESYFESENLISKVNEIMKSSDQSAIRDSLQLIFGDIKLNFINQQLIVSFAKFLTKIEKESLSTLLSNLEKLDISSKLLLEVISQGIVSYLHSRYENTEVFKASTNFLIEKTNLKSFKRTERFVKIFSKALQNKKTKASTEQFLQELNSNFSRNLNFISIISYLLKFNSLAEGQFKTSLENSFVNYYCENILSDDEREKNLSKQRFFNRFIPFLTKELIYNRILPDIEALMLRSSSNFKFLENLFLFADLDYSDEFAKELFSKYHDYFFSEKTFESAKASFSKIVNKLDKKILLEKLLSFSFLADKAELNLNQCYYLVNLVYSNDLMFKIKNDQTDKILYSNLTWEEFSKLATVILKKIEMQNENNKAFFESILDSLVKGALILVENLNCDFAQNAKQVQSRPEKAQISKLIQEDLSKQAKKLLTTSSFSFFYQHVYMLLTELVKKTDFEFDKQILDAVFNQINFVTNISTSNVKNALGAFALGFSVCAFAQNSASHMNTYKKSILQAVTALGNSEAFVLLCSQTQSENAFDFVNMLNIMNAFTSEFNNNTNFKELYEAEFFYFIKIVSIVIFYSSNKLHEKVLFRSILSQITQKDYLNKLLNNSFIYIMNNFSLDNNNNNNDFIYQSNFEKYSFNKLRKVLEYYALFVNDFEEKDFLKFLVLANLNNLDNNTKFNKVKSSSKGVLYKNKLLAKLQNLEKNESKTLEQKLCVFTVNHHKTIASFIFSDIGLFNKLNITIKHSCLNILKFTIDKNLENTLSHFINICFDFLEIEKLKFIDEVAKHYKKELDYISFYDLENLVESLKATEKKYLGSLALNLIPEKKVNLTQNISNAQGVSKGTKGPNKAQANNTQQKPNTGATTQKKQDIIAEVKIDKEVKILEYRNFIENFMFRVGKNLENNLLRIFDILEALNFSLENHEHLSHINHKKNANTANNKTDINLNKSAHKSNLIFAIKKIWGIFSVEFASEGIKKAFLKLFQNNQYAKKFSTEFTMLIFAEANPKKFNAILDQFPNILETFNEKLGHLLDPSDSQEIQKHKIKIFENFDFVIIRILFFSILANEVSNDQKSLSVDNLIKIIETLNKEILNFEDISTLAVGLLKTSYNNENLSSLLEIFMKRCSQVNFLTLCNDILEYEYMAKVCFLEQILHLNYDYLRNYKNLVYKIWVMIFDENDNISNYATKIWNKFHLYLDEDYTKSKELKMAFTNHHLVDSINSANRAFAFVLPNQINALVKEYENFYEEDLEESKKIEEENKKDPHYFDSKNEKIKRLVLFDFIDETVELFSEDLKKNLLDFLTRVSEKENNQEIFGPMNTSIFNIIKSITNEGVLQNIIEISESNIRSTSAKSSKDINQKALKIVLMILNSILMKDKILTNQKIRSSTIDQLYDSIYTLSTKIDDYDILLLIGISFLYLSKENQDKSKTLISKIITEFKTETSTVFHSGKCFILASLVKFFGISSFKSSGIYDAVMENMKKPKSIIEKQNAILLIKVFSFSLKKLFEPYLVDLFDKICELITDREEQVRNFTQSCVKSFMKELSGYGVKSIMPRLIKDLHSMNWRSKVVNIEILGQFAFCAPKQLSVYIPKVIKEIMIVFKDPHHKVQETAVNVLKDISSVIKNPEIVELSSLLIDAISNPPENSKGALTALLETDFKHAIDPPSLALIIPIIDYNLKVDNEHLKKMAAHVIGSIANLIIDPIHIFYYLDIIMPNLKVALFDGIPECRNAMSKAIGSLAKSLGEEYLKDIIVWLDQFLTYQSETVQKSGAAQAYSEILVAMGDNFVDKTLPEIISKSQENDHITKEGYLSIFVFLPGCMGERFEKYFDLIFPLIIEAFSDDHENVRNVSNKIFEICIRLYAKRNSKQLLDPLLTRLFDANWRIRNSSIALIKTLIMNLNKEFFKETSTSFPKELRDQVLCYTFILKADTCGNTGTIANMIWRDYVDNIPKYLSKILKNIYEHLMELLTVNNDDTLDIAEGMIKMLVTKYSDKFFFELVPIMKENVQERRDTENIVYATFYIIQLACSEASDKLLGGFKEKILKIVYENITTPHSSVRKLIASIIFEIASKFRDNSINKNFIHHIMKLARGKQHEEQSQLLEIVANLIEISEGDVLPNAMGEIFKKPYEKGFIALADSISETIAKSLSDPIEYKELYNRFTDVLQVLPDIVIKAVISITIQIEEERLPLFVEFLEKFKSKIESGAYGEVNKPEALKATSYLSEMICLFLEKTTQDISNVNVALQEMVVLLLINDDANIVQNLGKSLKYIVEKSDKIHLDTLLENFLYYLAKVEEKLEMEKISKQEHLTKNFKVIMDALLFFAQYSLLYSENKILASDYVQTVIDYTTREILKPYIMKFNGPLIRILSEKLSPLIKEKILDNIKSIIIKSKDDIKGISPQLQSVFIKTLCDSSQENSERAQLKAGENILRLLQYYPRTDVIANDIMKSISQKCEKGEGLFCLIEVEILSDIIRFYGSALKQSVVDDHYQKILTLVNSNLEIPYDILITLLSAYTKFSKDVSECEKLVSNTSISAELPRKLFNFITIFNGNLSFFNAHKKNGLKLIKPLPKDQTVIMLKNLGKVINKYTYFIEFDKENISKIIESYSSVIQQILMETDIMSASANAIIDANLCVFILSLGFLENYNTNQEFYKKVLDFVLKLVKTSKVNSQLLVNCLSLLTLKEIKPNVDHIEISNSLIEMNIDEEEVEQIENFLKKVYYFKDK